VLLRGAEGGMASQPGLEADGEVVGHEDVDAVLASLEA
jgi:hypothetical protein